MNIEEDTINPIISFFHKLLGPNLWILPVSVAIASWCLYFWEPGHWILLYIAIICSLIAILHICSKTFVWIKVGIQNSCKKRKLKEEADKKAIQDSVIEERSKREHANNIWKYVAHIDENVIKCACFFLDLNVHDDDRLVRYVKIPNDQYTQEGKIYNLYFQVIEQLTFNSGFSSRFELITYERVKDIMYFRIEPYTFSLLENYKNTGKWIKL